MKQKIKVRHIRNNEKKMDSPLELPQFKWTDMGTDEYFKAVEDINDAYIKILMTGKAEKVFWDQFCPMMTAKTREDINRAKRTINWK